MPLQFTSLHCILSFGKSLPYIKWICMCTVLYQERPDVPQFSAWHASKQLWHNSGGSSSHSSAQLVIFVIAVPSVVWCGEVRNMWLSGSCHGRCWSTLASPAAQKMLAQSVTCSDGKMCRCFIMLHPYIYIISTLLSCNIKHTFTISAYDAAYVDPSKNRGLSNELLSYWPTT